MVDEELVPIRAVDVRRAVLAVLIASAVPMTVTAVVDALRPELGTHITSGRASDVLRYQVRRGRVERIEVGTYRFVDGSMSQPTAWRCVHWRRARELAHERRSRSRAR